MIDRYIEVVLYHGKTSGFQSKEEPLASILLVKLESSVDGTDKNDREEYKLHSDVSPVDAYRMAAKVSEITGLEVQSVIIRKITTVAYEKVENRRVCPICSGSGRASPGTRCLCTYMGES